MRVEIPFVDLTGSKKSTRWNFFSIGPSSWSLSNEPVPSVHDKSIFSYKINGGDNTLQTSIAFYTFDFPPCDDQLIPYITYVVDVYLTTKAISKVRAIFDGPEDLALLWKLSM